MPGERARMHPAVVLDMGVNALGVIRSLGRRGVPVFGLSFIEPGVALRSKYCTVVDRRGVIPSELEYLSCLQSLCRRLPSPPVLFPTSDETLNVLSRYEEELSAISRYVLPERRTLYQILNKDETHRLAEGCGVRVPATWLPTSIDQLTALAPDLKYPILFKPLNHYNVYLPGLAKNLRFNSEDNLLAFFTARPDLVYQGVFQEIIHGGDGHILVCAAYFDRDSQPLAIYTGRKIRQLQPDFGVTSFGVSEELPVIAEMTVCLLSKIRFRGLVAVEYVEDRASGDIYFVEINARSYYHNGLFRDCGVDLSWIAYLDAVGDPSLPAELRPRQRYGRKWLDFARDARSFRQKRRAGELGWIPWLSSLPQARSFAVLDFDDPLPFVDGMTRLIGRQIRKPLRRMRGRSRHPAGDVTRLAQ